MTRWPSNTRPSLETLNGSPGASCARRPSPPATADGLADIVLPDQDCHDVRLGDLWSDRPAALVWLRHYG